MRMFGMWGSLSIRTFERILSDGMLFQKPNSLADGEPLSNGLPDMLARQKLDYRVSLITNGILLTEQPFAVSSILLTCRVSG
jgi:hypothetical protein